MKAWHFTHGNRLRDGSPLPAIGETLRHEGELIAGQSGLHACKRLIDALDHADGSLLHRVEVSDAKGYADVLVARQRTILWSVDVEEILRDFTRRCALDVVDLWDAPKVVVQYLKTGDERIRSAARDAAETEWASALGVDRDAAAAATAATSYYVAAGAARGAARASARAASRDVAGAAWAASRTASRQKQNKRLTSMVVVAYKQQTINERTTHK